MSAGCTARAEAGYGSGEQRVSGSWQRQSWRWKYYFRSEAGDGSAREQAASCQKVLGGWANIANEYATKRYRSNLINWGMLPFLIPAGDLPFVNGDYLFFPEIRKAVEEKADSITGYVVKESGLVPFTVTLGELTDDEREIILKGCLINYNRK